MYSLTINFGPTGTAWALLFKEKEKANDYIAAYQTWGRGGESVSLALADDFGQTLAIEADQVHGMALEDLEQVEAARIYRSLAEERLKVKLMEAARADPTIRAAMNQARPPVLTPMGGFRA